jgi:glycosyltransferase involved in cell wall biosynthesis
MDGPDSPTFSLIFPTYNPGLILARTLTEVEKFLQSAEDDWEVLFVCDGCTDGTSERIGEWNRSRRLPIRVLSYAPNQGKGFAVRHGLRTARGAWRIFMDVDLAYSFDELLHVASELRSGADIAIASRTHPASLVTLPTKLQGYVYRRHLQSLAFSTLVRILLPITQRDTQAGLKGLSAAAVRKIVPHLTCNGFGFDCELLTACARLGIRVAEVPVCVRYEDRESTTNFVAIRDMIGDLWRIRRAWQQVPPTPASVPAEPSLRQAA